MSIIVLAIIVVILLAIAIYGIQRIPIQPPFGAILIALCCLVAILVIAERAGLLHG